MNCAPVAKKVLQYLAHAEGICLSGGGKYGHIEKRRLTRFVLAFRNLVNSQIIQNNAAQDAHWYVINVRAYCAHWCIRRGLQCCCLD